MKEPTLLARYTSLGIILAMFSIWAKFTFVPESSIPGVHTPMHSYKTPLALTVFYLISLPLLRLFATTALKGVDTKVLLKESMVFYNVAQVGLNGWMVYRMVDALVYRGHFFIGDLSVTESGATFAVWVHYCDKYLEFFDTYFMVLRGRMDQVSFLHIYHHVTIAWAWWAAINLCPGGDIYFGALFNSWIHVMMYSYYALALLKYPCPWKRYLTMSQLFQFCSVILYTAVAIYSWETRTFNVLLAAAIQVFEMASLFVLFMAFYKRSYKKKDGTTRKKEKEEEQDDQCQVAVATATKTVSMAASAAYNVASKDASKIIETAKKAAPVTVKKNVDGMSRPSWSIIN
jgi:multisubunit Na+/H+ antiporter MnhG subunit